MFDFILNFNVFEFFNQLAAQAGMGFDSKPQLVIITILIALMYFLGRKIGVFNGTITGITKQAGIAALTPQATNLSRPLFKAGRFVWFNLSRVLIYFLTVVYMSWIWGIVYSGLPELMVNPFENFHSVIRAVGQGMINQPWLVLIVFLLILAEVAGRRRGYSNGVEEGINAQIAPAGTPPAGSFGVTWRAKRWERRVWGIAFTWSLWIITVAYIFWLWGVRFN